jgi:hypothetical protein
MWSKGQQPDLGTFLTQVGPLSLPQLAEVIRVDQRQRWQTGRPVKAKDYFRQFPEVEADANVAVDLIFNEFLLREKLGHRPGVEEYVRRFPKVAAVLRDQLELHRALEMADAQGDETPPSAIHTRDWPMPQPAGRVELPEVFGRYRIVRMLGQGGMGTVYLAHDSHLQRQVALKVPRFSDSDGAELLARFYREARIAATFHHPNLCPVYDVGEVDGTPYLTMPFLAGETLSSRLKRTGPLPQASACRLAMLVARAVHVAHQAGVLHRDLKPSNIMLMDHLQPVVMDFGLARRDSAQEPRLTAKGKLLGTFAYMPPEQFADGTDGFGPASDVYSLGVNLYEMLTGRLPFLGPAHELLRAVVTEPPPVPRQFRPDLDPALESICLKALAKSPKDRFRAMSTLAEALEPFAGALPRGS